MAGVKGRSGGARPGAGRKPRPPVLIEAPAEEKRQERIPNGDGIEKNEKPVEVILATGDGKDPIEFLESVMMNPLLDAKLRIDATKSLLPYKHAKKDEAGKKKVRADAAKTAAGGKFAPAAPPLRVVR